jgi:hypothetical protein
MTSCLMSSRKELLALLIDGATEALDEPYRESRPTLVPLGLCESAADCVFSVRAIDVCAGGADDAAGDAGLLARK